MNGHEYMTRQVVADHRDRLLAEAEVHRACRDALDRSRRPSLGSRLARLLARRRPAAVSVPTVRRPSPATRPG
jgi:hypothetical protein